MNEPTREDDDIPEAQIREYELWHCGNPDCEGERATLGDDDVFDCPCCGRKWPKP